MDIKPIETVYNGYRFRSRLEARWAVFFDAAGIEYEYEPDGFIGIYGEPYLPDFYLPQFDVYAEVKGSDEQLRQDWDKIDGAIDFGETPISDKGLIILGPIPYTEENVFPYFPFLYWENGAGTCATPCWFGSAIDGKPKLTYYKTPDPECLAWLEWNCDMFIGDLALIGEKRVTTKPRFNQTGCKKNKIDEEFLKARQARFEHGEKP